MSSIDFLVSVTLLMIVFVMYSFVWRNMSDSYNVGLQTGPIQDAAVFASNTLIQTPGSPANWETLTNSSGIHSFGFSSERNILNGQKIAQFALLDDSNHNLTREKLGLGKYDFYFYVASLDNASVVYYDAGMMAPSSNVTMASIERVAVLNGSNVRFVMEVWR